MTLLCRQRPCSVTCLPCQEAHLNRLMRHLPFTSSTLCQSGGTERKNDLRVLACLDCPLLPCQVRPAQRPRLPRPSPLSKYPPPSRLPCSFLLSPFPSSISLSHPLLCSSIPSSEALAPIRLKALHCSVSPNPGAFRALPSRPLTLGCNQSTTDGRGAKEAADALPTGRKERTHRGRRDLLVTSRSALYIATQGGKVFDRDLILVSRTSTLRAIIA